jgi:hypothetical protein
MNLERLFRESARLLIRLLYRVEYIDFDKIPHNGPVLIIANHVSYLDGLLIQLGCTRQVRFLIDRYIYETPGVNYFLKHNRAIPILPRKDSVNRALNDISDGLEAGDAVGIFPEGQITYTGHLSRFKPGIEWIIERDPVPIYPVVIKGLWGTLFSRKYSKSKWRLIPKGFRPKVVLKCGDVIHPEHVRVDTLQEKMLVLARSIGAE